MNIVLKGIRYLTDKNYRFLHDAQKGRYATLDDETYLKRIYRATMGYELNLDNPKTFNEKLQWLKIHDRKPVYTQMVDKIESKKIVSKLIGEKYIIPTLGVWDTFDDICFDQLPNQFVLKCSHDSGGLVICRNKQIFDYKVAKKILTSSLKLNYYTRLREWPYKDVKPRILAERYLENSISEGLTDYKVHSFDGKPRVILVCRNRFNKSGMTEDFYNERWEHLSVSRISHPNSKDGTKKPEELEEMLSLSRKIAKDILFVRTDFYIVNHKIFFGEITFFPSSGFKKFIPESFDEIMGSWLKLPL